jgi:hypothetical protein
LYDRPGFHKSVRHVQHERPQGRWDNQPGKFTLADLDQAKIKRFVERAKLSWDTPENALSKLELIKDGKLLNPAAFFRHQTHPTQMCGLYDHREFDDYRSARL